MRIILIIFGLLAEIFLIFTGAILLFGWLVLPILLILGLYHGFRILFWFKEGGNFSGSEVGKELGF